MNDNEKSRKELEELRALDELKGAIDKLAPDKEQRDRMWDHIESKLDTASGSGDLQRKQQNVESKIDLASGFDVTQTKKQHVHRKRFTIKQLAAIAAVLVLAVTGITMRHGAIGAIDGIGVTDIPAASGYVYAAENRVTNMTPHEILVFTGDPASNYGENEVYAPAIYYLDSSRLIFGNGYGLIIYDRTNNKVEGLIDLQAICSAYYNCDTVKTHITVNNNKLVIYNTKGDYTNYGMSDEESGRDTTEAAWGYYHIYDLNVIPGKTEFIECSESGKFDTTDCDMYREGKKFEEGHYLDAWDNVAYLQTPEVDDAIGAGGGSYSEKAYVYTDSDGAQKRCVLLCMSSTDNAYALVEENAETSKTSSVELETMITDDIRNKVKALCSLPAYEYTGDDPVMKVICEDMAHNDEDIEGEVLIPEPNIYGKVEEGDELLVFGDFFRDSYVKRGNTLVCVSGGSYPGCYHLKRSESGDGSYVVSSIEMAEDGEGYIDSIKEFTKGHPVIRSRFMASAGFDEAVRKECIKAYVDASGAGIGYYKDYGWDPIKL